MKNTDTTGTGLNGQLTWTYTCRRRRLNISPRTQIRVESFVIRSTSEGWVIIRQINVTITGTNDAPIVAAVDVTGGVTDS